MFWVLPYGTSRTSLWRGPQFGYVFIHKIEEEKKKSIFSRRINAIYNSNDTIRRIFQSETAPKVDDCYKISDRNVVYSQRKKKTYRTYTKTSTAFIVSIWIENVWLPIENCFFSPPLIHTRPTDTHSFSTIGIKEFEIIIYAIL